MSTLPDNELDLEKLFLPSWAQESSSAKTYENYTGNEEVRGRREGRGGPRREGGPGQRPRREGGREGRREGGPGQARGPRPQGGDRYRGDRRPDRRDQPRREPLRREPPPPLPELTIALIPEEKGVESLARQIKMTGRAYPLFDIAQMILQKPERHNVTFTVKKNAEGQPLQPLFLCALDDSLWLSEDQAVDHVLNKHFATFYQEERTATEPPKGKYTFVAQCGISGAILGPPNLHDYQVQLRKLHAERFSRMPFDTYKARVKIVRDEEVVQKWVESQSWKTEYICLNVPEPVRLPTMEAVAKHFRETHKEAILKQVESHTIAGTAARNLRSHELSRAYRSSWEDQRRFPLQIATSLSQQFASRGLQFFKVNKTVTHVSVARPHYLDLDATPVSEGVRKIVNFLNAHGKCTRRQLIESLAPAPALKPVPPPEAAQPSPSESQTAAAEAPAAPAQAPAQPEPSPEQTALVADLHWLIHQGHVIEFANGIMETAKKPLPKPPKPEKKPAVAPESAASPTGQPSAASTEASATEAAPGEAASTEPSAAEPAQAEKIPATETAPAEATAVPAGTSAEVQSPSADTPATTPVIEEQPPAADSIESGANPSPASGEAKPAS